MWSNRPLYFNLSSHQRFIVATWRKRSGTLASSNGSGHELRYPDEDPKLAPAEGGRPQQVYQCPNRTEYKEKKW